MQLHNLSFAYQTHVPPPGNDTFKYCKGALRATSNSREALNDDTSQFYTSGICVAFFREPRLTNPVNCLLQWFSKEQARELSGGLVKLIGGLYL